MNTIISFKDFLSRLKDSYNSLYDDLKQTINDLKSNSTAKRYSGEVYNDAFEGMEINKETANQYIIHLTETKKQIEELINIIANIPALLDENSKLINNQQLRSGLQGQIKEKIMRENPDVISSLPESIQDFVLDKEYVDAPYIKKGGKWSLKYKKSINCRHPKGFSQRQHCKYGRAKINKKRGTRKQK